MDEQIVFGDRLIPVKLPERTKIASPGLSVSLPPAQDLRRAIQEALKNPLGMPPLYELAKLHEADGWFPDRGKTGDRRVVEGNGNLPARFGEDSTAGGNLLA